MDIYQRLTLIEQAKKDPNVADMARELARRSCVDFCNMFGWIFEPRPKAEFDNNHHLPVELFEHEIKVLEWLDERCKNQEDGLIEKSRDMGVTWTAMVFWNVWKWLFSDDFACLIGSRKENDVDNRTASSIFGKIDYFLQYLPDFIKPMKFDPIKHRNHMKLINPENGNTIVGEATNPQFSRSGRFSTIFLDEFAFVDKSYSIWQACGDSTSMRIAVSTPFGKGNKFADLALHSGIKKLTLHWSMHPLKDKEWYEKEKERRTPDEIAQELDISYEGSQKGRVYGDEWDQLVADDRKTEVKFDPELPVYTSWDFGIADATAIGFYQITRTNTIHLIDYYENTNKSADHYIRILEDKASKLEYRYAKHYGDIAGNQRNPTNGKSMFDMLKAAGFNIKGKKLKDERDGINAAKLLLRKMYVNDKLDKFIDAIENYHYLWDEEKVQFEAKPYHDWSSHACKQLEYFAIWYRIPVTEEGDDRRTARNFDPLATTTY